MEVHVDHELTGGAVVSGVDLQGRARGARHGHLGRGLEVDLGDGVAEAVVTDARQREGIHEQGSLGDEITLHTAHGDGGESQGDGLGVDVQLGGSLHGDGTLLGVDGGDLKLVMASLGGGDAVVALDLHVGPEIEAGNAVLHGAFSVMLVLLQLQLVEEVGLYVHTQEGEEAGITDDLDQLDLLTLIYALLGEMPLVDDAAQP